MLKSILSWMNITQKIILKLFKKATQQGVMCCFRLYRLTEVLQIMLI